MNCPRCDTPNPASANFCSACSQALGASDVTMGGASISSGMAGASVSGATMASPRSLAEWSRVSSAAQSAALPPGLEIGHRYQVVNLLGQGGMGAVYRVRDRELNREVALKLIRADIAEDAETLERFKREIHLSSLVTHKNVLRVYDLGESEGIRYLTMQLVSGEDLSSITKRGHRMPIERTLKIFRQICEGLRAAHEQGVVHRDLKPQNVMLGPDDMVYLTDFGLARSVNQSGMTQTGAVIGTPFYMSPEQVKGTEAGPQSDIYSLGVILYEMVTGKVPFTGRTPYEVMVQRLQKPPRPASETNAELPAYLGRILQRCMEVDPALRYQSVEEILTDLDAESFRSTLRYQAMRRRWLRPAAAAVVAVLLLGGIGWFIGRRSRTVPSATAAAQPRSSVLVADFENRTGEAVFDGTLEPAFGLALEGASFVTSFNRGQARKIAAQLQPGSTALDQTRARLVAVREGINVVTSGSVERSGDGYRVSVRAMDAATGKTIETGEENASGKEAVLGSVNRLAARVRAALGDSTPASAQIAAAETYTAASLDAAHEYAVAQDFQWAGNWDEAIRHYRKSLDLDPNLGRAYAGLAAVESNRGRRQDAEKYYKEALARIDRMSEREKFRTRGGYYLLIRNPDNAIEEFSALVRQYPADTAGIANLAAAYFYKRDFARALQEARRAVEAYPKNVPQRNNLGLDAMYAGDFETAIREQDEVLRLNPKFVLAYVSKALSQLAQGHPDRAAETYGRAAALDARGASVAAAGLADIAMYQGRPADAVSILKKAVETDVANGDSDAAAEKLMTQADAHLELRENAAALAAAERAVGLGKGENVLYPAARVYLAGGRAAKATALADQLAARLEPDPQAYAELIRGEAELAGGNAAAAIRHYGAAKKIADTWAGRLDFGKAYLEAGAFAQADQELEACLKRRGEATALFLEESPSYRLFPQVYYYLGRVREGLKSPAAVEAFRSFLSVKTGPGDALVADARRRVAAK